MVPIDSSVFQVFAKLAQKPVYWGQFSQAPIDSLVILYSAH